CACLRIDIISILVCRENKIAQPPIGSLRAPPCQSELGRWLLPQVLLTAWQKGPMTGRSLFVCVQIIQQKIISTQIILIKTIAFQKPLLKLIRGQKSNCLVGAGKQPPCWSGREEGESARAESRSGGQVNKNTESRGPKGGYKEMAIVMVEKCLSISHIVC